MPWLQLIIDTPPEAVEDLEDALLELGAQAVTLQDAADQPLFEPAPGEVPLWNRTCLMALLDADTDTTALETALRQRLPDDALGDVRVEPLEDRDWVRAWMEHFEPMRFGERLWIVPGGFEAPEPDAVNIQLDPGLAFGTGTHPTTAMCLRWLDAHPPAGQRVIDYGCGSGVLALAARLLGADHVLAVDTDPQALLATADNAARNALDGITPCLPGDCATEPVDLLLANILAGPLQALAPRFAELVRPGGQLVLAGILATQAQALMAACAGDFDLQQVAQQEEWVCLAGHRH